MTVELFEVGGAVRDDLLGIKSKDVDFVAIAPSFDALRSYLIDQGFHIFVEKPEFCTIRARVPEGHKLCERTNVADFVLARKDGPSSDGRRPDFVEPGSLLDDLARRDFTINAMARDNKGNLFDPFGGQEDLALGILRFVGDPMTRISEDGLRVLRFFRFCITKGLKAEPTALRCANSAMAAHMVEKVSVERIREELEKMCAHNTLKTIRVLSELCPPLQDAIFRDGLRLSATLKV